MAELITIPIQIVDHDNVDVQKYVLEHWLANMLFLLVAYLQARHPASIEYGSQK